MRLNIRKPSPKKVALARKILKRPKEEKPIYHRQEIIFAERALRLKEEWPDSIDMPLQAFRIGALGIAAAPFEVFAETGLEIKAKCPFKTTFTIELANALYGYLPTLKQHKLGGYETWMGSNKVEKDSTVKIVTKLLLLFSELD